jgi:hypothetical protein
MNVDRLRWLINHGEHVSLDGAAEIAKAAPELLAELERLGAPGKTHKRWAVIQLADHCGDRYGYAYLFKEKPKGSLGGLGQINDPTACIEIEIVEGQGL